jgi:hypothetical protein
VKRRTVHCFLVTRRDGTLDWVLVRGRTVRQAIESAEAWAKAHGHVVQLVEREAA